MQCTFATANYNNNDVQLVHSLESVLPISRQPHCTQTQVSGFRYFLSLWQQAMHAATVLSVI